MYRYAYAFVVRGNINKLVIILKRILIPIATRVTDLISIIATRMGNGENKYG